MKVSFEIKEGRLYYEYECGRDKHHGNSMLNAHGFMIFAEAMRLASQDTLGKIMSFKDDAIKEKIERYESED